MSYAGPVHKHAQTSTTFFLATLVIVHISHVLLDQAPAVGGWVWETYIRAHPRWVRAWVGGWRRVDGYRVGCEWVGIVPAPLDGRTSSTNYIIIVFQYSSTRYSFSVHLLCKLDILILYTLQ